MLENQLFWFHVIYKDLFLSKISEKKFFNPIRLQLRVKLETPNFSAIFFNNPPLPPSLFPAKYQVSSLIQKENQQPIELQQLSSGEEKREFARNIW